MTGTAIWKDESHTAAFSMPRIGDLHPKDSRLVLVDKTEVFDANNVLTVNAAYFGLWSTERRISYSAGTGSEPVESHPDFTKFAGTQKSDARNGAVFYKHAADSSTGTPQYWEFQGFYPTAPGGSSDLSGVTMYLKPSGSVEVSYYTDRTPSLKRLMKIHSSIPGFSKPDGVRDFLLVDMPYRQIGKYHYQMSEVYLCSGERGWNSILY